jgi:cobalt-zinc-cadmium efflux system outer membrane protein
MRFRGSALLPRLAFVVAVLAPSPAHAQGAQPTVVVTIADAVRQFRARGLDLLVSEAQVHSAQGDVRSASALANPQVSPSVGRTLGYDPTSTPAAPCDGCSAYAFGVTLTDPSALSDLLSGKRALRERVAEHAVAVARENRRDVERQLLARVKSQVVLLAGMEQALALSKEVQASLALTEELTRRKYPGSIDEGVLARVERERLEADNNVEQAAANLRTAQVGLAYLVAVRGEAPFYAAAQDVLAYRVPAPLTNTSVSALLVAAAASRPDLRVAHATVERATASLDLAKRSRVPDVGWYVGYSQTGTGQNAIQPPLVSVGLNVPLPVLYQRQGEIAHADAERQGLVWQEAKTATQVSLDVQTAYAAFTSAQRIVERTRGPLLERAARARDITEIQFRAGALPLIDYLDAHRAFVITNGTYLAELVSYWNAVFQLEAAVGVEWVR